ncbi:acyl carrier protein [Limnofasciculus baicalensis]|uniref:Acyl carrier protein n=1 Tax=Limnofasciculus baicalensis BBK-W-15 TaxID=2699891 RepID=A0AAE3GWQ9_9CYAN|nr:acyl carrier protein [Limnofasciculus baicalensis]MCP2731301.1 acyl carrier protein [Limnofasciculus baicalensis BBK-W-15]
MSEVDKSYELKVLKMVANKYLDETISATERSLRSLEANPDQVVWELATRIYSQSGYKVELGILRDVVNSRIEFVKYQLASEKERMAEEARRVAEEARRVTELKAAEAASLRDEMRDEIISIMGEIGVDERQANIFVKLRKIISEQLDVNESEVTLDSNISTDLNADGLEAVELAMALEEEFEIEIPEDVLGTEYRGNPFCSSISSSNNSVAVSRTVRELFIFIQDKVSP